MTKGPRPVFTETLKRGAGGATLAAAMLLSAHGLQAAPVIEQGARAEAGVDPTPGSQVPGDITLTTAEGRQITTGDLFSHRPALLALVYYGCPNQCSLMLSGVVDGLRPLSTRIGKDADVIAVSIDPSEGTTLAAAKGKSYLHFYGRGDSAGWHFLTGSAAAVSRLAKAVGVRFAREGSTGQYAHPAALVVIKPGGLVSHYLYGLTFAPRDLRLAIAEATGSSIFRAPTEGFLLLCFHYDEATGRYAPQIKRGLQVAGGAFLLGLICLIGRLNRVNTPVSEPTV